MIEWLRDHTELKCIYMAGYSDYYPEQPGGKARGRGGGREKLRRVIPIFIRRMLRDRASQGTFRRTLVGGQILGAASLAPRQVLRHWLPNAHLSQARSVGSGQSESLSPDDKRGCSGERLGQRDHRSRAPTGLRTACSRGYP